MVRPFFHATILSLTLAAAAYAAILPGRTTSQASLLGDGSGLSFAGAALSRTLGDGRPFAASIHAGAVPASNPHVAAQSPLPTPGAGGIIASSPTPETSGSSAPAPTPTVMAKPGPACDPSQSTLYCVYTVQSGDSLAGIATKFSLKGTESVAPWQLLVQSNKPEIASESEVLQIGQKLRVPIGNAVLHTVLSSETISEIADQYDVASADVVALAANGIANANTLRIGQEILVPSPNRLSKPAPPVAAPAAPSTPGQSGAPSSAGSQTSGSGAVSRSGFTWPAGGPISSSFGASHPLGIDIDLYATPNAANVAAAAGTVTFAGGNPCCSYGYYVVIDHGNGYQSLYAHFSKLSVSTGQKVSQGQVLGMAGRTGYATGNHLHFELRLNGTLLNPMDYLP